MAVTASGKQEFRLHKALIAAVPRRHFLPQRYTFVSTFLPAAGEADRSSRGKLSSSANEQTEA